DLTTWEVATWNFTDPYYDPNKRDLDEASLSSPVFTGADAIAWSSWEAEIDQTTSGELKVFLRLTGDRLRLDSSFYSTSTRLHSVLAQLNSALTVSDIFLLLSEMTLMPRCTKQLDLLKEILEAPPFEVWRELKGADILRRLNGSS